MSDTEPPTETPRLRRAGLIVAIVFLVASLAVAALLVRSGRANQAPTPITEPSPTAAPTETPIPSATPTATPTPTATEVPPTATATTAPDLLTVVIAAPALGDSEDFAANITQLVLDALGTSPLAERAQVAQQRMPAGSDPFNYAIEAGESSPALLITWAGEGDARQAFIFAPPQAPPLAEVGNPPQPWQETATGRYPISAPDDSEHFLAELSVALLEASEGEGNAAIQRLGNLRASSVGAAWTPIQEAAALFTEARAQVVQGNLADALTNYSEALRLAGTFPAASAARADAYLLAGDAATALQDTEVALIALPDIVALLYNHALMLRATGEFAAAQDAVDELLRIEPGWEYGINLRGAIAYDLGDYESALSDFERVATTLPDEPGPLFNQAMALRALDQPGQALVALDAAVELAPDNPSYVYELGRAFETADEPAQAEDAYTTALTLDSEYPDAYLRRGRVRLAQGDAEGAYEDAQAALEQTPDSGYVYWLLGDIYIEQGSLTQADGAYRDALALGVEEGALYAAQGWALQQQQYRPGAIDAYDKAIELGYDEPVLYQRSGYALYDEGRYAEANQAFSNAIDRGLDTAELQAALALTLDAMLHRSDAERQYEQALLMDARFGEEEFLEEQPLWSNLAVTRAVTILRRLGIDPYE